MEDPQAIMYRESYTHDAIAIVDLPEISKRLIRLAPESRQQLPFGDIQAKSFVYDPYSYRRRSSKRKEAGVGNR
jgi:hypothetical protein